MANVLEEIKKVGPLETYGRVGVLLVLGIGLEVAARVFVPQFTTRVAQRATQPMDLERAQRSATVVRFSTGAVRVVLWAMVLVSLLSEININVGPLLAGAGVFGAALAFGAQNIIKDYLAGFFILLENQYTLGDVIRVGAISGTVEEITMRITVLRGIDGAMYVVPNGTIQTVANLTSVWARVVIDLPIAYSADLDAAIASFAKVGKEMREDPAFSRLLLEDAEVLGLNALTDTAMVIRFQVKVVPEFQWKIQRELLRRLKRELDAKGIPAPYAPAMPPPVATGPVEG